MKKSHAIILSLVEVIKAAIDNGDWKVDGRCDPEMILNCAENYLERKGIKRDEDELALLP